MKLQRWKARDTVYAEQYYTDMEISINFDEQLITEENFLKLTIYPKKTDGWKRRWPFVGHDRNSNLIPVVLLEACDCLKSREELGFSVHDVREP